MNLIRYVDITNFKTFSEKVHIDLGHPAVLIGPNNAGKTSVIQALSLWSQGAKSWQEKKGKPQRKEPLERLSAGINRLNILDVPVAESRFFWRGTRVRRGNTPIEMTINVGLERAGKTKDCRLIFTYRDSEVIYCKPCPETAKQADLLQFAASLQFHLLYPMSGIMSGISSDTEETPLPDGRINVFLGQGQTAQVLRNLCYKVVEQDNLNKTTDWKTITHLFQRLFLVELNKPAFNETRGSLVMTYRQQGVDSELDISLAGRGMQQILLILAYLFWHKRSVLLVDEPDAHLEILRQKQVYEILKDVAGRNHSQVIIATHSEVILDDAVDTNLTLLLNGEAVNLAQLQDMKNALRSFGIEQYYKAKTHPRILYIEGSTDLDMLRELARLLKHPAAEILGGQINCHYVSNVKPDNDLENRLDRISGVYGRYDTHFHTLKRFVPELQGLGLFDGDGQKREDIIEDRFAVLYWKHYELENYFITPDILIQFARKVFTEDGQRPLFEESLVDQFTETVDGCLLEMVFNNDEKQLSEFHAASGGLKRTLLRSVKMSEFSDRVFSLFAKESSQPIMLNKGEFYKMIELVTPSDIDDEVKNKLDYVVQYLRLPDSTNTR